MEAESGKARTVGKGRPTRPSNPVVSAAQPRDVMASGLRRSGGLCTEQTAPDQVPCEFLSKGTPQTDSSLLTESFP